RYPASWSDGRSYEGHVLGAGQLTDLRPTLRTGGAPDEDGALGAWVTRDVTAARDDVLAEGGQFGAGTGEPVTDVGHLIRVGVSRDSPIAAIARDKRFAMAT